MTDSTGYDEGSFNHFRHFELIVRCRGSITQDRFPGEDVFRLQFIFAITVEYWRGMGGGLDTFNINALELLNVHQNLIELPTEGLDFFGSKLQPGQIGDFDDLHGPVGVNR